MDKKGVFEDASRFRQAIEEVGIGSDLEFWFSPMFPAGDCGVAADLLGEYLQSRGHGPFMYVLGSLAGAPPGKEAQSHAWLRQGDWIIDITADQFPGCDERVIVSRSSIFHEGFAVEDPGESMAGLDNRFGWSETYRRICEYLDGPKA